MAAVSEMWYSSCESSIWMFIGFMVDILDVSVIFDLVDAPFVKSFLVISNLVGLFVDINGPFVDFLD